MKTWVAYAEEVSARNSVFRDAIDKLKNDVAGVQKNTKNLLDSVPMAHDLASRIMDIANTISDRLIKLEATPLPDVPPLPAEPLPVKAEPKRVPEPFPVESALASAPDDDDDNDDDGDGDDDDSPHAAKRSHHAAKHPKKKR